jgi:hypothetical protein
MEDEVTLMGSSSSSDDDDDDMRCSIMSVRVQETIWGRGLTNMSRHDVNDEIDDGEGVALKVWSFNND